jgi:hypothetical protein
MLIELNENPLIVFARDGVEIATMNWVTFYRRYTFQYVFFSNQAVNFNLCNDFPT